MALSLGVSKGSGIMIGDHLLTVLKIEPDHLVTVEIEGREYDLTDSQRVEVLPEVFLSYGRNPNRPTYVPPPGERPSARVAFEAPRSISILRADRRPARA